jgi:hypothetical protein
MWHRTVWWILHSVTFQKNLILIFTNVSVAYLTEIALFSTHVRIYADTSPSASSPSFSDWIAWGVWIERWYGWTWDSQIYFTWADTAIFGERWKSPNLILNSYSLQKLINMIALFTKLKGTVGRSATYLKGARTKHIRNGHQGNWQPQRNRNFRELLSAWVEHMLLNGAAQTEETVTPFSLVCPRPKCSGRDAAWSLWRLPTTRGSYYISGCVNLEVFSRKLAATRYSQIAAWLSPEQCITSV